MRVAPILVACVAAASSVAPGESFAERADRDKPTNVEANRMLSDDVQRLTVFEGNVVMTKGTIRITAERVVVRQDAEGFQVASATGKPVRFRQKSNPKGDREAVWIDGEALRVEVNEREERVELFEQAKVTRDQDEVRGSHIVVDQRTDSFSVTGTRGADSERVKAVLQPKNPPSAAAPAGTPAPAIR